MTAFAAFDRRSGRACFEKHRTTLHDLTAPAAVQDQFSDLRDSQPTPYPFFFNYEAQIIFLFWFRITQTLHNLCMFGFCLSFGRVSEADEARAAVAPARGGAEAAAQRSASDVPGEGAPLFASVQSPGCWGPASRSAVGGLRPPGSWQGPF